jgi:hypothetical protein
MMIKYKYWLIIATIFVAINANAQKYALSGYLKDSLTNEFLIGATVQIENSSIGVASNAYGFTATSPVSGDVPSGKIKGNILNLNKSGRNALGYFGACSISIQTKKI